MSRPERRRLDSKLTSPPENISAFEVDESALQNLREYSLANSLYWALAEGHACEQSARRNAMDVSRLPLYASFISTN